MYNGKVRKEDFEEWEDERSIIYGLERTICCFENYTSVIIGKLVEKTPTRSVEPIKLFGLTINNSDINMQSEYNRMIIEKTTKIEIDGKNIIFSIDDGRGKYVYDLSKVKVVSPMTREVRTYKSTNSFQKSETIYYKFKIDFEIDTVELILRENFRYKPSDVYNSFCKVERWFELQKLQGNNSSQFSLDIPEEIKKYKELLDEGAITKSEYEKKKKQLLDL